MRDTLAASYPEDELDCVGCTTLQISYALVVHTPEDDLIPAVHSP
jgi:hypothetical protein